MGHGIDNHLFALQTLAIEEVKQKKVPETPALLKDPVYIETMRFPLSTSQVIFEHLFEKH